MKRPAVKVKVTPLKEDEEKKAAKAAMKAEKAAPKTEQAEKKAAVKAASEKAAPKAAEKSTPKKTVKTAPKAAEKPEKPAPKAEKQEQKGYSGKWVISQANGGYTFELRASNGETMLTGGHYTTLAGAKGGIETYKSNIRKGNFRIVLGQVENCEARMDKLMLFLQRGIAKRGWNRYKEVNLKFENQIVCVRK